MTVDLLQDQAVLRQGYLDAILASSSPRTLIVAGPGTGKTYTFGQLLKNSGEGDNLALTFIRKLVSDMESELSGLGPSFYQALAAFRERGLAGLLPRRRGPRQGHKLTDEVMDFVEQAGSEDPSLGVLDLIDLVGRHFGVSVHRRSLERALRRRQKKRR